MPRVLPIISKEDNLPALQRSILALKLIDPAPLCLVVLLQDHYTLNQLLVLVLFAFETCDLFFDLSDSHVKTDVLDPLLLHADYDLHDYKPNCGYAYR